MKKKPDVNFERNDVLENAVSKTKEYMEERYRVKLPDFEVKTSDNVPSAFLVPPTYLSPHTVTAEGLDRCSQLGSHGLTSSEMKRISSASYTIFLPTREGIRHHILEHYRRTVRTQRSFWFQPRSAQYSPRVRATIENARKLVERAQAFARAYRYFSVAVYGSLWEEMGHLLVESRQVKDSVLHETVGLACHFHGLLFGVKTELFPQEEALYTIEALVEETRQRPNSVYTRALQTVEKHIHNLDFRHDELNDLLCKLDACISHALASSESYV